MFGAALSFALRKRCKSIHVSGEKFGISKFMMNSGSQSRIVELAAIISSNTKRYDHFLSSHSLPPPTFDSMGPLDIRVSEEMVRINGIVVEACSELQTLMLGPMGDILNQIREVDLVTSSPKPMLSDSDSPLTA